MKRICALINPSLVNSVNFWSGRSPFLVESVRYATFNNRRVPTNNSADPKVNLNDRYNTIFCDFVRKSKDLSNVKVFKDDVLKQAQQWRVHNINEFSFDGLFMRACVAERNYSLGCAYLKHLSEVEKREINVATLSKFLQLSYFCRNEVKDVNEVDQFCRTLQSRSEILDTGTKEILIMGLSITSRWKEGLQLMSEDASAETAMAMNAMVDRLLLENELTTASELMERLSKKNKLVYDGTYEHWIRKCIEDPRVWDLFSTYLMRCEVFLNERLVHKVEDMFIGRSYTSKIATVENKTGKCRSCGQILQPLAVCREDFDALKSVMMEKILVGDDVFRGSTPEEVERFKRFVRETGPYDVVIDGLNTAYKRDGNNTYKSRVEAINSVINYFSRQDPNQKILLLGRNHMLRWSSPLWKDIKRRSFIFTTEDISRDDPFLLYAAIQKPGTKVVSDDIFRNHLFQVKDRQLETVFRIWQRSCQLQILKFHPDGRTVSMLHPLQHRTVAQTSVDGSWHIPYDDGTPRFNYQLPTTWLCVRPKQETSST